MHPRWRLWRFVLRPGPTTLPAALSPSPANNTGRTARSLHLHPLLYERLTEELKLWHIAPTYRELLASTAIQHCQDWVTAIDLKQQRITLRQKNEITYDYLVVALGSQIRPPTVPGSQLAMPFATLEDAWILSQRLAELEDQCTHGPIDVVVAGAGPSGVELACKLADRLGHRGRIAILDRRSIILRSLPVPIQRAAARALAKRQIDVYTHASIQAVQAGRVIYHHHGQTHQRQADLVIWTVGTVPHAWPGSEEPKTTPLAQCIVRPTLQLVDYDNVLVLGDMAAMPTHHQERAPMTAQSAFQAAPIAAHNLWALATHRPLRPFCYHHLGHMLTLGQDEAIVFGFGLCLTGQLGAAARRWAYWLRLPTWRHRWRVLRSWLAGR
ncbi:MAG: FAD-dependent oxidoreductase [Leptolyngbyaceae cyanobacterium SM2_5_2]|nr:FAD-dependent oxidoreductase [Leptolyngbyaceae cyanobacterium SM2_5_2]